MKRSQFLAGLGLVLVLGGVGTGAQAQGAADWPKGPVKVIVGFAPGGSVDLMGRFFAKKLQERLGQPFVVENRPGAGGNIGANLVAKAKPDGATILMTSVVHSINPSLFSDLQFDTVKDFAPVSTIGLAPNAILAHPSAPFKTVGEMVAYAKANPGKVSFAHAGGATTSFLGMAIFESLAGIKLLAVPYNGTGPATLAAIGGQVQLLSGGYGSTEQYARDGKLRMLGITTARPSPLAPGVPTVAEGAGLPTYEVVNWMGMFLPAGTPKPVVDKLHHEIQEIARDPEAREWMKTQGVEPLTMPPEKFAELVRADIARYGRIVKDTGVKAN